MDDREKLLALLRRCRDVLEMIPSPLSDCYTNGLQPDLYDVLGPIEAAPITFDVGAQYDDDRDDDSGPRCGQCGVDLSIDPCTCGPAGPYLDGVWTGDNNRRAGDTYADDFANRT
jgi:hypothetical protein